MDYKKKCIWPDLTKCNSCEPLQCLEINFNLTGNYCPLYYDCEQVYIYHRISGEMIYSMNNLLFLLTLHLMTI